MKAFVVFILAVLARDTIATPILAVAETGASAQFRSEDNLGNYNFGYNEDHTSGGTFRREAGDAHGNVAGSYGLRDADGRIRIVNYVANDDGFKADIQTNEPGVEPKDTADATFNKAESVLVETVAAPAPYVAIPQAEPVALKTEQVAVSAPVFPPVSAVPVAKTVAQPIAYAFPEPAAVPVAKTISTVAEQAPLSYAFPAPAAVPVSKSSTTTITTEAKPAAYAFPAPAAVPVAKSATTTITTEAKPFTYAFPAPAAVPVAKSASTTITTETKPVAYAFPAPAAVPVAKSSTTTTITEAKPFAYAFPEPAAVPVAKSIAAPVAVAPSAYAFPAPAAVPVAKSSTLHYSAQPIATAPLAYAAAPNSKFSYATQVQVNNAPAHHYAVNTAEVKYAPSAIAYAPALRYTVNPHLNGFRFATPFYKSLYSPVVASFAGPVPYFNNIEYHGYPVVKK